MPTCRRNGQILLLLGVGGLGPRRAHPGSLFFLPQGEKSLWNRNSSCCRWGKWGLGGVSAMPEAAIKAQTANNSHSGNLLKSYILSCRHFGKEIHFPWPLILVLLFQTSAAPTTATCQPLPRGSPASLKGQWGPGNTFPLKQMIFLGAVDKPYYRDFSGDSRTLFCLLFFFFITKVIQACYKQSRHGELYKEKCNSGPIFFSVNCTFCTKTIKEWPFILSLCSLQRPVWMLAHCSPVFEAKRDCTTGCTLKLPCIHYSIYHGHLWGQYTCI